MSNPSSDTIRTQVMGCWLGKAIGGTLGQEFEGLDGPLTLSFYDPVPTEMVPNDDLDLQVVWARHLANADTPVVDRDHLAEAWLRHVDFPFNEYAVAKRNLREGLKPPESGSVDNWFTCGEGAAIRSELWACLAPGDPATAAAFAYEDACVDHAGDGVAAAQFLAATQARAFTGGTVDELLDAGLSVLDPGTQLSRVVVDTRAWFAEGLDWQEVRSRIVDAYGSIDFTDVRMNTGFVVLGLLAGGGDFEASILITNNCGKDTDSSTASVGSTLGIWKPDGIPERWLAPIGRDLRISPGIVDFDAPATVDDFTDLVLDLAQRILPPPDRSADPTPATTAPLEVDACFYSLNRHSSIRSWFLPPVGPEPEWPTAPHRLTLTGTWAQMAAEEFEDDLLMLEYTFDPGEVRNVRVVVNTPLDCRVWLDGQWLFGRDGNERRVFPTPHMPPLNQYADVDIAPGLHRLRVVVRRPAPGVPGEWVVAVANASTYEWITNALRP
ncbi:ADP-ribosylglycohydrolase family protein [Ruania rhizosphaerae]|uniref:ADP-ribosylglycohydrolase family protein n=1 Tax=Ruania rhizosphaerae TaxID=1840413 RepID=UPI0013571415|nr:ADP-ribosylglycohydrolase family protein [Ruania rhizosphaerae]